jgi:hypothetical protein
LHVRSAVRDPAIVGRTIILASRSYAVIGVVPDDPSSDLGVDVWMLGRRAIPQGTPVPGDLTTNRHAQMMPVLARLKPGVPVAAAQAELDTISAQLARACPRTNMNVGTRVQALQDWTIGESSTLLLILIDAVTFLLLIDCVNVANLLLARARAGVRTSWQCGSRSARRADASFGRCLIESSLLAVASDVLGFLFAWWSIGSVLRAAPEVLPRLNEVTIETRAFAFACAVTLIAGLVFGLWPAIRASRPDLIHALRLGARTSQGRERRRLQQSLVLAEPAIAQILLVGAGLLLVSFVRLTAIEAGFDPKNVLTVELSLPAAKVRRLRASHAVQRTAARTPARAARRVGGGDDAVAADDERDQSHGLPRRPARSGARLADAQFIPISESIRSAPRASAAWPAVRVDGRCRDAERRDREPGLRAALLSQRRSDRQADRVRQGGDAGLLADDRRRRRRHAQPRAAAATARLVGAAALLGAANEIVQPRHNRRASSAMMSGNSSGKNSFPPGTRRMPRDCGNVRSR